MTSAVQRRRDVLAFVGLVFAISTPFYVLGAVTDLTLTKRLSIASLMIVAPFIAAVILVSRSGGVTGVRRLLIRAVDPRLPCGARWYLPVLLLMPAVVVVEVVVLRLIGRDVPPFDVAPLVLIVDLVLYWIAATLEEVGWTGYLTDRLLATRSLLATSLVIGLVWAAWHLVAILEMPASHPWAWVAFQLGNQVVVRVLIVWVYVASGRSLFAAIGMHAVLNVSVMTLFPVYGSHYDPLVTDLIIGSVALVVLRWWTGRRGCGRQPLGFGRMAWTR